jgi:hypothetical protein
LGVQINGFSFLLSILCTSILTSSKSESWLISIRLARRPAPRWQKEQAFLHVINFDTTNQFHQPWMRFFLPTTQDSQTDPFPLQNVQLQPHQRLDLRQMRRDVRARHRLLPVRGGARMPKLRRRRQRHLEVLHLRRRVCAWRDDLHPHGCSKRMLRLPPRAHGQDDRVRGALSAGV